MLVEDYVEKELEKEESDVLKTSIEHLKYGEEIMAAFDLVESLKEE